MFSIYIIKLMSHIREVEPGGAILKRHRIATTISDKHWKLLKIHAEKFETQRKALEIALECLENNTEQYSELTVKQKYWLMCESIGSVCCVQKEALKILMETVNHERFKEYVTKNKPIEYEIQILLQKPLNECSLEEVVNGLMIVFRTSHMFDTIDCKDNGDYYLLILTHSLGLNNSKLNLMTCKSLFITYGADIESKTSGNIIFIKVFKDKTL
ncbi:hypothetical protein [Methanosarcina mazei]|jgi:hypothetical protein|uniref:hypothetical protein n=1 Tax=Methanosarcina mazei TaxID=2209 RepID=UPI000ACCE2EC|nr:hypothetical protein [Methanosarcina mazei]WIM44495.1 hypothetical protein PSF70_06750 [Methanosarcina mazei]WIM47952.1 hypothetical protein PQQ20_06720 [Methanosarcina mazei]